MFLFLLLFSFLNNTHPVRLEPTTLPSIAHLIIRGGGNTIYATMNRGTEPTQSKNYWLGSIFFKFLSYLGCCCRRRDFFFLTMGCGYHDGGGGGGEHG